MLRSTHFLTSVESVRTFSSTPSSSYLSTPVISASNRRFSLSNSFISSFASKPSPFGFNGLGELVYRRTYSRVKDDGENEKWYETVARVVNGTYNMQKSWIESHGLGWDSWKAQDSAQEMFERIWSMKFLPPGRGLWSMGSPITEQRGLFAALNNCAFVSTADIASDPTRPFCFLMDASMLGVGVGFDTLGAGNIIIRGPSSASSDVFVVPDTREGWVEALRLLLESHFLGRPHPKYDFSLIRPAGTPIKGFGGIASGPSVLIEMLDEIDRVMAPLVRLCTAFGIRSYS